MKHVLRTCLIFTVLLFTGHTSSSQTPAGNDWVLQHISQPFWKFPVHQTGIHRIDSATLAQTGVLAVPGFDPRKIQVFHNGKEIAVYVHGEDDGVFNTGDFVEFFGRRNDASMDKQFFEDTAHAVNKEFSLFTDTSYYFLTVGTTLQNKRLLNELATDFSNYLPAEDYFMTRSWYEPAGTYSTGSVNGDDFAKDSRYFDGEGWVDFPFGVESSLNAAREVNLITQGAYLQGPAAQLKFSVVGRSRYMFLHPAYPGMHHHVKLSIDGVSTPLDDFTYAGYSAYRNTLQIPASNLSTGFYTKFIFTAIDDMSTNPGQDITRVDRNSVARLELTFPHGTSLNNSAEKWMYVPDHPSKAKSYFSLTNMLSTSGEAFVYDLTNERRIKVIRTGNNVQMLIPNSLPGNPATKECFLSSEGKVINVTALKPLTTGNTFNDFYTDFFQNQYDYLIITHTTLLSEAAQYAAYRKNNGYPNLYNPIVADVEELYEQFSYGIRNNPLAIENFLKYLYANSVIPKHIFILGKGYSSNFTRHDTVTFRKSLVPGWGYPATDNIFVNRLSQNHINDIYIGRVAASTPQDAAIYLEKVMQHEDSLRYGKEMWMKRAIHLGGGSNAAEQTLIKNNLNKWKGVLEAPYFGGNVTTILKTTTEPIQIIQSQQLKNLINDGVRIMTFYGHGSATGFDISIDEVNSYSNEGKYPLVIVNSCYSGDLFNKIYTKSEEFVLTEKKGAIAYFGASNYSTIQVLNLMNDTLYHHMANASYGKTLGEIFRNTLKPLTGYPTSFFHRTSYQQSTLHGDPAIVLSVHDKPDYRIDNTSIFFTPANVTSEIDTFAINIISSNAGKAVPDSFVVRISRTFPDKATSDTTVTFPSTWYKDTFVVMLPVNRGSGVGLNLFEVELDAFYQIDESDETNNKATVPLYIKAANLIPVYPYEFAVIPDNSVTLFASTSDPFSAQKSYHFQLSLNPDFINLLAQHTTKGSGGIFSWKPPVTLVDSTVYFWRVSVDSSDHPEGVFDWRTSSFRYIDQRTGWAQAHFDQFLNNSYQYIRPEESTGNFLFVQDNQGVTVQTGVHPNLTANQHFYSLNGVYQYQSSNIISQNLPGGFVFAIFDTIAGLPVKAINSSSTWDGNWGNFQQPNSIRNAFEFPSHTAQWRDKMAAFFDSIPNGYYVLAYSMKNHHAPDFPEPLYQAFESIGSSLIRTLQPNTPYVIFGRKGAAIGDPQWVKEANKSTPQDTIRLNYVITSSWNQGHIVSQEIGPAKNWQSVYWKQNPFPADPYISDSIRFSVIGIDAGGNAVSFPALTNIPAYPDHVYNLDQIIDASQYPYIRLKVEMTDDVFHTPAQMKSWMVLYTPVGETALDPGTLFVMHKDTIQQGDSLWFKIATRNISAFDMDSLLVNCRVTDGQRKIHHAVYKRYRPHPAGDTLIIDSIGFNTASMSPGLSTLWIEVNPVNPQTGRYDQPEQTHINNIGEKLFLLSADNLNPLLDVTFDGIHILDGDIVSAQPAIEIQLNDENRFLMMNLPEDTALFRVYLKSPSASEFIPVYFRKDGIDQMIFYPADGKENRCRILFPADFAGNDGLYLLRIEAADKSQNQSGSIHYQISFRVISESTITEVLNWPNPFSTKTHFVFTLTGHEVPTDFRIQIMTITGKIIRELTMNDLGPINIGRNITSGYWDGTDQFGDRVGNGVYLYRVITNIGGETILKSSTGADRYFKDGWGKMYLMR